ncbi:putative t-SNARE coiled-coil homology domain-containing protein [Candidatus Magnetomoraceae bacterium gMMP-15]
MKFNKLIILFLILMFGQITPLMASEDDFKISGRELIETLAELKAGQKTINARLDQIDKRIDDLRADTNKRIDDLRADTNKRFQELRADTDKRFDQMFNLMLWGFGILFSGIFGLIGFVVWDRKHAVEQLEKKIQKVSLDDNIQLTDQLKNFIEQKIKEEFEKLLLKNDLKLQTV